ncbi:hypothetical protein EMPG_17287 [Blastomyces silverae]|uniref:Uncharacterized protein n=1 Tax=Blastomyces silverae TaxID=2060906 RepID=A0A0H1B891_9EURO|nr:hypothetical protein EMPG_17287 [Blastomyces silverae]
MLNCNKLRTNTACPPVTSCPPAALQKGALASIESAQRSSSLILNRSARFHGVLSPSSPRSVSISIIDSGLDEALLMCGSLVGPNIAGFSLLASNRQTSSTQPLNFNVLCPEAGLELQYNPFSAVKVFFRVPAQRQVQQLIPPFVKTSVSPFSLGKPGHDGVKHRAAHASSRWGFKAWSLFQEALSYVDELLR